LSFFDEADETRTATHRSAPRRRPSGGPRRRPSGGPRRRPAGARGRRPSDRQAIQLRRVVAALIVAVLGIVIVLGVRGCEVSRRNNSLKDYNNNVASLIERSDGTSGRLFSDLARAQSTGDAASVQTQINQERVDADSQLAHAKRLNVPDEVKTAQQYVLLALRLRQDGIAGTAQYIQPALADATNQDAIDHIAAEMARFYASDVVYKSYALPELAGALHRAGIRVGGTGGEQMNAGQFLPDVGWLTPAYVASQLQGGSATNPNAKPASGIHGHRMDQCSIGSTTLPNGGSATLPASPPPTFTCKFTNDGQNREKNVIVRVTVSGTSISGQTVVPNTTPGAPSTATITLGSAPRAGTYTVTAAVEKVPGETVTTHNSQTYQVTFQ